MTPPPPPKTMMTMSTWSWRWRWQWRRWCNNTQRKPRNQQASQLGETESPIEWTNGRLTLIDRVARWRISIKFIVATQQTSRRLAVGGWWLAVCRLVRPKVARKLCVRGKLRSRQSVFPIFLSFHFVGKNNEKSLNKRHDSQKQITVIYFAQK